MTSEAGLICCSFNISSIPLELGNVPGNQQAVAVLTLSAKLLLLCVLSLSVYFAYQGHGAVHIDNVLALRDSTGALNHGLSLWDNVNITHGVSSSRLISHNRNTSRVLCAQEVISFVPNFVCHSGSSLRATMYFIDEAPTLTVTTLSQFSYPNANYDASNETFLTRIAVGDMVTNDLDLWVTQGASLEGSTR